MTRYKLINLASCAVIILLGLLYFKTALVSRAVMLFASAVCMLILAVSQALEQKAAGAKGFPPYIQALCYAVVAALVFAAAVYSIL
ncbi:MAG: hypothetical protein IJ046_01260 [Clostridia bacterium]|nr:hypothetical protein [Clostridia bacterium]